MYNDIQLSDFCFIQSSKGLKSNLNKKMKSVRITIETELIKHLFYFLLRDSSIFVLVDPNEPLYIQDERT